MRLAASPLLSCLLVGCISPLLARAEKPLTQDAPPWRFTFNQCADRSERFDYMQCQIVATNLSDTTQSLRLLWQAPDGGNQNNFSHVVDPDGRPFFFFAVWGFEKNAQKGVPATGSSYFTAAAHGNVGFNFQVRGVDQDAIELDGIELDADTRATSSHSPKTVSVTFKDVPIQRAGEDNPDSPLQKLYFDYPILRRWGFLLYEVSFFVWFLANLRHPGFLRGFVKYYCWSTLALCLLAYGSSVVMYWRFQNWRHGYEWGLLPITMSNGPTLPGAIPKNSMESCGLIFLAISLYVTVPQCTYIAWSVLERKRSWLEVKMIGLGEKIGIGIGFLALCFMGASIFNPYRGIYSVPAMVAGTAILFRMARMQKMHWGIMQGGISFVPGVAMFYNKINALLRKSEE